MKASQTARRVSWTPMHRPAADPREYARNG